VNRFAHAMRRRRIWPILAALHFTLCASCANAQDSPGGPAPPIRPARTIRDMGLILLVVAGSGALGGFAMTIGSRRSNELFLPGRTHDRVIYLGFIGDMFVGSAASLAINFVADPLLSPLQSGSNATADYLARDYIRAISLGVIAGFAGIKVLTSMARISDEMISASKAQLITRMQENDRSRELVRQVEDMLAKIDDYLKRGDRESAITELKRASEAIEQVLSVVPRDPRALVVKAKILKRNAQLDVEVASLLEQAIQVLTAVLAIDSSYDRAYYNRACYEAIRGRKDEAMKDLNEAVRLFAPNRGFARDDHDFDSLRNMEGFKKLINAK
jgi:hypothetical protein